MGGEGRVQIGRKKPNPLGCDFIPASILNNCSLPLTFDALIITFILFSSANTFQLSIMIHSLRPCLINAFEMVLVLYCSLDLPKCPSSHPFSMPLLIVQVEGYFGKLD
jgi:hypothetical protein